MANPLSQSERTGKLTTPFGENELVLAHMSAVEGLSELFEFRIEAASLKPNLDFNSALGLGATVKLIANDKSERYFHGIMTEARWAGESEDIYSYELVLRPWFWLLTRTSDCRIFHAKNALEIIKKVCNDRGFTDIREATSDAPPQLEYCVQYRETDYNFCCRLMEEFGIYYFFEHENGKHTMVLANAKSSHKPVSGLDSIFYNPALMGAPTDKQHVQTWSRGRSAQSGKFTLNDYDYNKPPKNLLADSEKPGGYSHDSMEMYDYPGGHDQQGDGAKLAKFKVEAAQSLDNRRAAKGQAPSLFPGALITLKECPVEAENQEYLITRCTHTIDPHNYRSGGDEDGPVYVGLYETSPSDTQFRAPLVTRKPEIAGVQSGLVVNDSGGSSGEIDVDKLGRVRVLFYWDRKKNPSRRVRVAQSWAGKTRGALFLPRIGDEVMIAYEDGDPDRPLVVGSVYNGDNTVPMTLSAKQMKSGILTKSTPGGAGYHMLMFDDTAGSEVVKLRSQKDLKVKALNDETRVIGNDQKETIGGNITKSTQGNEDEKTAGNVSRAVDGGETVKITSDYSLTSMSSIKLTVGLSSITISPQGVTIQAPTVTVNGDAIVSING